MLDDYSPVEKKVGGKSIHFILDLSLLSPLEFEALVLVVHALRVVDVYDFKVRS